MSYSHITSEERYVISYLVLYGLSLREIVRNFRDGHTIMLFDLFSKKKIIFNCQLFPSLS